MYSIFSVTSFVAVDFFAILLDGRVEPLLLYCLHALKYIMMYSSFCFMLLYTSIAVNQRFHGSGVFRLFITPLAVVALLMIINYSDSFIFYITKDGRFELGRYIPSYTSLMFTILSYLPVSCCVGKRHCHKTTRL